MNALRIIKFKLNQYIHFLWKVYPGKKCQSTRKREFNLKTDIQLQNSLQHQLFFFLIKKCLIVF